MHEETDEDAKTVALAEQCVFDASVRMAVAPCVDRLCFRRFKGGVFDLAESRHSQS